MRSGRVCAGWRGEGQNVLVRGADAVCVCICAGTQARVRMFACVHVCTLCACARLVCLPVGVCVCARGVRGV